MAKQGSSFPIPPLPKVDYAKDVQQGTIAREAPRIPWDKFIRNFYWKPGEHIALIGPTGQGKTTLLMNLLPLSRYNVVFATKPKDESMDRLIREGDYQKFARWQPVPGVSLSARDFPRRVLWPSAATIDAVVNQRKVFADAFAKIYIEGGWTVAIDELWYVNNILKLSSEIRMFLLQGRSLGISLIAATQRPRYVPLEIYDQSTHLFFWRDNDRDNLERLSGINARSSALVKLIVSNLDRFQVLYINTRTGAMMRTRAPALQERG